MEVVSDRWIGSSNLAPSTLIYLCRGLEDSPSGFVFGASCYSCANSHVNQVTPLSDNRKAFNIFNTCRMSAGVELARKGFQLKVLQVKMQDNASNGTSIATEALSGTRPTWLPQTSRS